MKKKTRLCPLASSDFAVCLLTIEANVLFGARRSATAVYVWRLPHVTRNSSHDRFPMVYGNIGEDSTDHVKCTNATGISGLSVANTDSFGSSMAWATARHSRPCSGCVPGLGRQGVQ